MFKTLSNFKHFIRVRFRVWVRVRFRVRVGLGLGLGLRLRLGLRLLNSDVENNKWRHLLNILNDRIVEVLRFSVTLQLP